MKRILILILLTLLLASCENNNFDNFSNETNFNNIYNFSYNTFWATNDCVYYGKSGFYNLSLFCKDKNGSSKLFDESDLRKKSNSNEGEIISNIQAVNKNLYLWFEDSGKKQFYKYNKENDTLDKIFEKDFDLDNWVVVQDKLIYSDTKTHSVFYYDLKLNVDNEILTNVYKFGIVKNNIRYIYINYKFEINPVKLCEYNLNNGNKKVLGNLDENVMDNDYIFNFVENYVVYFNCDKTNILYVYDIKNKVKSEYNMPNDLVYISCYQKKCFVVLKGGTENHYQLMIFGIKDGTNKIIKKDIDCQLVNAISDEYAYIVEYSNGLIKTKVNYLLIKSNGVCRKII